MLRKKNSAIDAAQKNSSIGRTMELCWLAGIEISAEN